MKMEFLNNAEPLPQGHPHAGEIGVVIDFEDGRPATQRVYAADKDALLQKAFTMYGNTQARITELKNARPTAPASTPPARVNSSTPATAAEQVERTMRLTSDLQDPNRVGNAVVEILKDATGVDLAQQAETNRRKAAVATFMENNPDFVPGPSGALVRDRAAAVYGDITVESLQAAYDSLREEGLIHSQTEQPPATHVEEPSAPTTPRREATATSYRPSTIGSGGRAPAVPKLTYADVLRLSETPEYEERLRNEPGFQAKVNQAIEDFEKQGRRAG